MNKAKQQLFNAVEEALNELWKEGKILRSVNPETKSGEYVWMNPQYRKKAEKKQPHLGGFVTYKEFQSQIN